MKSIFGILILAVTLVSIQSRANLFDPQPEGVQTIVPGGVITEYPDQVYITLEGIDIQSIDQLQTIIAQALHLPATYGKNFDALYDVLTDTQLVSKRIDLGVISGAYLEQAIGAKNVKKLIDVLVEAQEADPMHISTSYWQ